MAMLALLLAALLPSTSLAAAPAPARVYLHPAPSDLSSTPELSPSQAHAVISYHLGIDRWVDLKQGGEWIDQLVRGAEEESLVGSGQGGVVLLVESDYPEDIMSYQQPEFTIPSPPSYSTFSTLLKTYSSRLSTLASPTFNASSDRSSTDSMLDIFSLSPSPESETVREGLETLSWYADWVEQGNAAGAALELRGMGALKESKAEVYEEALIVLDAALNVPALANHPYVLLILPSSSSSSSSSPSFDASLAPSSTCYASFSACDSSTSSCSGHGQCVQQLKAGKTCYVCSCGRAEDASGRNVTWAGATCEKVDVSGSFTLLIGSTLFMIVIAVGSVMLLYGVGTQELPSTLVGAAPGVSKRD